MGLWGPWTIYLEGCLKEMGLERVGTYSEIQGFSQQDRMEGLFWTAAIASSFSLFSKLYNCIDCGFKSKGISSPTSN